MLEALVRGQGVLGAITSVAEFTYVQRVGLLVLVLEVALEGVVAAERPAAVGALLGLVDASRSWWRHPHGACNSQGTEAGSGRGPGPDMQARASGISSKLNNYTDQTAAAAAQAGVVMGL
ncbi:hypothetical protein WA026_010798 [Henosepilachna vigintioctopunctata]|uniref:Uncharacterized protein n=1 Tax=Henosepilachna vigintioctopunctata TaxID=420089 RepID=A0AAW1UQ44_9CUCU